MSSERLLKLTAIWPRAITVLLVLVSVSAFAPEFLQAALLPAARAQSAGPEVHAKARLIADTDAIVPGKSFRVAAELNPDAGWHTYYKEPGDAGMPTRINWNLPEGFKASADLLWEKPQRFSEAGITTYGYDGKTLVAATITPPTNLKVGTNVTLNAEVKWLTCKEVCVPGKQSVQITLPVAASAHAVNGAQFGKLGFTGSVSQIGAGSRPPLQSEAGPKEAGSNTKFAGDVLNADLQVQGTGEKGMSLWAYIGLALVGGFILNFMPCVLPVISIKVLSFMEKAGEHPKDVFRLGLIFSAGIISSFLALAGLVAVIQAAGQKIGWGFQFQFPAFLLGMSAVVLVFALSLFGLIYFQVNAGQEGIDKLARDEGAVGTFFKGVLATTLSTPCSAPFLGTALGFAFSQPVWVVVLIFFCIGLGMASPYLVLTAHPSWMRFLPKPGVWMEKFKESMGFLLLATVVWLIWVLGQQVGINAMMAAVGFLVCLSFAVWLVGRFVTLCASTKRKAIVYSLAAGVLVAGYATLLAPNPVLLSMSPAVQSSDVTVGDGGAAHATTLVPAVSIHSGGLNWQPFTVEKLDTELKGGKTVFIDFTADWCLTCKVNEATVINTPPVISQLKQLNAVTLRADWTRQDPMISRLLAKFGRSGVPLYVIFPGNNPNQPIVLPEAITQQMVIEQLQKAGPSVN